MDAESFQSEEILDFETPYGEYMPEVADFAEPEQINPQEEPNADPASVSPETPNDEEKQEPIGRLDPDTGKIMVGEYEFGLGTTDASWLALTEDLKGLLESKTAGSISVEFQDSIGNFTTNENGELVSMELLEKDIEETVEIAPEERTVTTQAPEAASLFSNVAIPEVTIPFSEDLNQTAVETFELTGIMILQTPVHESKIEHATYTMRKMVHLVETRYADQKSVPEKQHSTAEPALTKPLLVEQVPPRPERILQTSSNAETKSFATTEEFSARGTENIPTPRSIIKIEKIETSSTKPTTNKTVPSPAPNFLQESNKPFTEEDEAKVIIVPIQNSYKSVYKFTPMREALAEPVTASPTEPEVPKSLATNRERVQNTEPTPQRVIQKSTSAIFKNIAIAEGAKATFAETKSIHESNPINAEDFSLETNHIEIRTEATLALPAFKAQTLKQDSTLGAAAKVSTKPTTIHSLAQLKSSVKALAQVATPARRSQDKPAIELETTVAKTILPASTKTTRRFIFDTVATPKIASQEEILNETNRVLQPHRDRKMTEKFPIINRRVEVGSLRAADLQKMDNGHAAKDPTDVIETAQLPPTNLVSISELLARYSPTPVITNEEGEIPSITPKPKTLAIAA